MSVGRLGAWASCVLLVQLVGCAESTDVRRDNALIENPEEAYPGEIGRIGRIEYEVYGERIPVRYMSLHGEMIVDGDIVLGEELHEEAAELDVSVEALAARTSSSMWPDGLVPYAIDPALPSSSRVTSAIAHWEANTALRFVRRTSESAYVYFTTGSGCSSGIGYSRGRTTTVRLDSSCSTGTTIHEIGHAVGLWHTQARADRDSYVRIHPENIQSGYEDQFEKYTERSSGRDVGVYDVGSIMHYGSTSFSRNGRPTITRLNGSTFSANRSGLSTADIAAIAQLYGPNNGVPSDAGTPIARDAGTTPVPARDAGTAPVPARDAGMPTPSPSGNTYVVAVSPATNAVVVPGTSIRFEARAGDPDGISSVRMIWRNGDETLVRALSRWSGDSWGTRLTLGTGSRSGPRTVTYQMRDSAGRVTESAPIQVYVR